MTLTLQETFTLLYNGKIAERIWTGKQHIWMLEGEPCTRAINTLRRKRFVWEHYPHNGGSAGINERGKSAFEGTVMMGIPIRLAYFTM